VRSLLDRDAWRIQGISSWQDVSLLGSLNLGRLVELVQARLVASLHQHQLDPDERRSLVRGLDALQSLLASRLPPKPLLPRLRNESFHQGDSVQVFLGDSPGSHFQNTCNPWIAGKVTRVDKAFNPAWASGEPNSGYHWQVTVETSVEVFPRTSILRFSTSEPRALKQHEFDSLTTTLHEDPAFFSLWCSNARRDWSPIWCLERNQTIDPSLVDFARWLCLARPSSHHA
jgi:hypothetical protein